MINKYTLIMVMMLASSWGTLRLSSQPFMG